MGASHRQEGVDSLAVDCVDHLQVFRVGGGGWVCWCRREEELVTNGRCKCNNLDAIGLTQVLFCDCTGSDSSFMLSVGGL